MAGRSKTKPVATVPKQAAVRDLGHVPRRRAATKRRRDALLMAEALEIAKTYDISVSPQNNVVDTLQLVLDRTMDLWRFSCKEVDKLTKDEWLVERVDAEGNRLVEPHVWIQYEAALRGELTDLGLRMGHLGVDERKVRVVEAQTELLGRALMAACQEIGLPADMQRRLGSALRKELIALEAGVPAPALQNSGPNDKHPQVGHQPENSKAKYDVEGTASAA